MTDPKDLDAIDDGWGEAPEPAKPEPARPAPKPVAKVQLKHLGKPAPPPPTAPAESPPDDDIEFEADAVARDSMPTFQHPNPLQFDQPDTTPRVPGPPPLPKFRKKR
ncbi:MAG: hypothetical protein IT377_12010 [Polyangiaceae bacterium]|nr:hypothetical protein [Myxococcales bacterium]MCC6899695.1 hypothetical protein [Polyangiaceae bacterium]